MANLSELNTIWRNIREIDLQVFRSEALREIRLVVVGAPGTGRHVLVDHLRRDPSRIDIQTQTPVVILDLNEAGQTFHADLIVIMIDAYKQEYTRETALISQWINQGKKVIVFFNQMDATAPLHRSRDLPTSYNITGSVNDVQFLHLKFTPLVMELLPGQLLSLGRRFPLFRVPIAHHFINETCLTNATYALGTGLAEVAPVLNLPLTVADMVVLTKTQAFLVYKLGLVFGFSLEWRDYLAEFGSVIGSGFLWRQLARSLVGLIPVLGIVPKIAVSYSGTFVVGHTILQWYLTGRKLSAQQMKALTVQAFQRGQHAAQELVAKVQRPSLKEGRKSRRKSKQPAAQLEDGITGQGSTEPQLEAGESAPASTQPKKRLAWSKKGRVTQAAPKPEKPVRKTPKKKSDKGDKAIIPAEGKVCPQCGKSNALDANFCQYCAAAFNLSADNENIT